MAVLLSHLQRHVQLAGHDLHRAAEGRKEEAGELLLVNAVHSQSNSSVSYQSVLSQGDVANLSIVYSQNL